MRDQRHLRRAQLRRRRKGGIAGVIGLAVAVLLVAAALPAAAAPGDVVVDNNFAAPHVPAGTRYLTFCPTPVATCPSANPTMGGWDVYAGSVDLMGSSSAVAPPAGDPAGTQVVDMDGSGPGGIEGPLHGVTANTTYVATFELYDNCGVARSVTISIGGVSYGTFTAPSGGWALQTFSYTPVASGDPILQIQSTTVGTSYCGAKLTDVSIAPPPVVGSPLVNPALLAGIGGGVGVALVGLGLVAIDRRRRSGEIPAASAPLN